MTFTETQLMMMEDKPKYLSVDEKKIRKKCKQRISDNKNKEKKKIYYQENKEKKKIYYQENKEEILDKQKEHYQENKEELIKINIIRYENNKEEILDKQKKYSKTPQGYKTMKKSSWKTQGLNMNNFEEIFKRYCETTKCDLCNRELTKDKKTTSTTKCMDHDHQTGEFRNVLCHACNRTRN